ncbi:MAG: cysteine desulfurase [Gemmatimonadales bacterium]|jgi:cysteine desulfurase/selenocysteine lyase
MTQQLSTPLETKRPIRDVARVRADFPVLASRANGKPLVYLDNAATTQKPRKVIDALTKFYSEDNANIHRGVHHLSQKATLAYEGARGKLQRFLNAADPHEVVFVRGTTEAINLVAHTFGRTNLTTGDEILVSTMEHHANIVPWQIVCEATGAKLRVIPMTDSGELEMDAFRRMLTDRTKLVGVVHISNALGTINPVKEIAAIAHDAGVPILIDGAQAAPHGPIDVQEIDADFYALSGHKMFGPTGIGVLYGKAALLDSLPPYEGGGEMIRSVTFEKTTYAPLPAKFEAGTPHIAGAIGLGAAVDYIRSLSWEWIQSHEQALLEHATKELQAIPGVRIVGAAERKAGVLSFVMEGVHAHDIGTILDMEGIAIRTGHHCTQPLMKRLGLPATARASLAFYNTQEEVEGLIQGIRRVSEVFV